MEKDMPLTLDPADLCFIDSETRRLSYDTDDVTEVGAYLYATNVTAPIWVWAIGHGPVDIVTMDNTLTRPIRWADMGREMHEFHERVKKGEAWYVAWNAAFDRQIWNAMPDFPKTRPEHWIDAMAQATASGLPGKLKDASRWIGTTLKLDTGTALIKLFEPPNGETPAEHPERWEEFVEYAAVDVEAMRDIYYATRPLDRSEWEDYWVCERINDRGMMMDPRLCAAASILNDEAVKVASKELEIKTLGTITSPTQIQRMVPWVWDRIEDSELRQIMVERKDTFNEDGTLKREGKLSLDRPRIERMIAYIDSLEDTTDDEELIRDVIAIRMWCGSNTPAKFRKALKMLYKGRLRGSYVFNGAPQTGRYSSRGVQTHNLSRDTIGEIDGADKLTSELAAIDFLINLDDPRIDKLEKEADR
jgi:DNA polymerase